MANRNGPEFSCERCGFTIHADLNAARDLSERGIVVFGRAEVSRPNVARDDAAEFLPRIAVVSRRL